MVGSCRTSVLSKLHSLAVGSTSHAQRKSRPCRVSRGCEKPAAVSCKKAIAPVWRCRARMLRARVEPRRRTVRGNDSAPFLATAPLAHRVRHAEQQPTHPRRSMISDQRLRRGPTRLVNKPAEMSSAAVVGVAANAFATWQSCARVTTPRMLHGPAPHFAVPAAVEASPRRHAACFAATACPRAVAVAT